MQKLQELLDQQAIKDTASLRKVIRLARGDTPPNCWSNDDCSTSFLAVCPWRIDCGEPESVHWYKTTEYKINDLIE